MHFTVEYPTSGDWGNVYRSNTGRVIDDFYSATWTERFDAPGEATLELPMKYWPLALDARQYPNGHYLHFSESDYVMNLTSAQVKTRKSDTRVVLKYKSIENFLSFRRMSWNARDWVYHNAESRYYDITDVWHYEFFRHFPVPFTSMEKYWDTAPGLFHPPSMQVYHLDQFKVGDTVLDVTTAACRQGESIRERFGFRFDIQGEERRSWRMRVLPTNPVYSKSTELPDWTDHIAALDFAFDTSTYSNAIMETWPKHEAWQKNDGSWAYSEAGSEYHRSNTYATYPVRDWNRVERFNDVQFPGTSGEEAAVRAGQHAYMWSWEPAGPNQDLNTIRQYVTSGHGVTVVCTTPEIEVSKNFQYRKHFNLGDLFNWTPYSGLETVPGAWASGLPRMTGLITEVTWLLDESGVKITPSVAL